MIEWNPTDVLTCLEVEPEVGGDQLYHRYNVHRDAAILDLVVCQYDGDVHIVWGSGDESSLIDL